MKEEGTETKNNAVKEIRFGKNDQKIMQWKKYWNRASEKIKFSVAKKIMIICENTCRGPHPLS